MDDAGERRILRRGTEERNIPGHCGKNVRGYRGISLLRRDLGDEIEFVTIMWFDTLEDVKAFAGDDYETAVVLEKPRALLSRFDSKSAHFETLVAPEGLGTPVSR